MKKIGIITIIDNDNYGNRLQNYAVQEIIKKFHYEPVTMLNKQYTNDKKLFLLRLIRNKLKNNLKKSNYERRKNFECFNKLISFSKENTIPFKKYNDYAFFITGSDQVWNPNIGRMKDIDLLSFAPGYKRISLSASFGISSINHNKQKKLKRELKKFKSISVRENSGKEIVKNVLPNKNVCVLIDPTMMLDAREWNSIAKKPNQLKNKKYVLNYFLGTLSEKVKNDINQFALNNNCGVINILDVNSPFYKCGPSEFLFLEKNAFLICTDSFHASVFAILNRVPFIVFDRYTKSGSMNNRLETLLLKFDLLDRKYNGFITNNILKVNYSKTYTILGEERKKVINFLSKALELESESEENDK